MKLDFYKKKNLVSQKNSIEFTENEFKAIFRQSFKRLICIDRFKLQ